MSEEKILTAKEKNFCYNYVMNPHTKWNGTRSAIEAGYSKNSACEIAHENLRKPHIVQEIDKLIIEGRQSHKALEEKIILEREKLAFSDLKDYIDPESLEIQDLTDIDTSSIRKIHTKTTTRTRDKETITELDVKFELHDKSKNLDSLAAYLGIDRNDLNLRLDLDTPIEINFIPVGKNNK